MCLFVTFSELPPSVGLALRTLQYFVIPVMSLAILVMGGLYLGQCPSHPMLPLWHLVAGKAKGIVSLTKA